ncbi:MAG: lipoyl(octanoyl) transferase [Deltaproteobacteria bacterium]|nr:MAG: lipoyl(octanoyl) transferase [Deltaproteobacteria bacterium]
MGHAPRHPGDRHAERAGRRVAGDVPQQRGVSRGAAVRCRWLGRQPYEPVAARQRAHREALGRGEVDEEIWLLEHEPVVTTGRRPVDGLDVAALAGRGIPVVRTERGGLATWHGPGQLVAYLLIDVGRRGIGVRDLVHRLEEAVIAWLATRGLTAARRPGLPGVWVGRDKICAVGLHVARGRTMHGLALNIDVDLSVYRLFTPCGVHPDAGGVTSLVAAGGAPCSPLEAATGLAPGLVAAIDPTSSPTSLDAPEGWN